MTVTLKNAMRNRQDELMKKYEELEDLKSQFGDKDNCIHIIQKEQQALDEEADLIQRKLERGCTD